MLEGLGELHYYANTESMTAFCHLRDTDHAHDCRKSMSANPVRRGSGRPIGYLVAWLRLANQHTNRSSHVHSCVPTLRQRQEAREFFQTQKNWLPFASLERARKRGQPDEPKIP